MQIAAPAAATFTVKAKAFLKDEELADGSDDGAIPGDTNLHITLRSSGIVGAYSTRCATSGGSSQCVPGLVCKTYGAGETGVCTHTCTVAGDCATTSPAAVCADFPGTLIKHCQWDCTTAGCPVGLTCRAAANSGGKSYCTGI
jgi:hypothetical protein